MKRIIYSVVAALSLSFMSAAQSPSVVTKMPGEANGYLILNKAYYDSVSSWRVVVKEKVPGATRNAPYTYTTKLDEMLTGKNYIKIPEAYRNVNHVMEITGYAGVTTVVQANEMPIGDPVETMCTWVCNGSNYAYGLQMNYIPSQNVVKISMQSPPPPEDAPYYYQWVSESNWNTFKNQTDPLDYGFSDWNSAEETDAIIHIDVENGYKYDQFGWPLNGLVVGVSKYFGPYREYVPFIHSNGLTAMESDCAQPISWPLNLVNQGDETPVNVACSGTSFNTDVVETPYAEVAEPEAGDHSPCFEDYYDYIGWHAGSGSGVYQLIQIPCNWVGFTPDPGSGTGTGIHWPEHVSRITLKSVYGSVTGDPVTVVLENDDLFDDEGNFIGPNYSVPAGFYNVLYQYDDLSIGSYFVEVTVATGSQVEEKDFLSYTAYPVPIQDNSFSIDFSASKKVSFTYELRDASNNLLFADQFTVEKDEQVTKTIEPTVTIPNGLLYSKLIFSDDSVVHFTIIK